MREPSGLLQSFGLFQPAQKSGVLAGQLVLEKADFGFVRLGVEASLLRVLHELASSRAGRLRIAEPARAADRPALLQRFEAGAFIAEIADQAGRLFVRGPSSLFRSAMIIGARWA